MKNSFPNPTMNTPLRIRILLGTRIGGSFVGKNEEAYEAFDKSYGIRQKLLGEDNGFTQLACRERAVLAIMLGKNIKENVDKLRIFLEKLQNGKFSEIMDGKLALIYEAKRCMLSFVSLWKARNAGNASRIWTGTVSCATYSAKIQAKFVLTEGFISTHSDCIG